MAHGHYLAPSQKLMSKTIIIWVLLLGLIYQAGNKMKQSKLQKKKKKRAASDRAHRKVNKLTTVLMYAINTYIWSSSFGLEECVCHHPEVGMINCTQGCMK